MERGPGIIAIGKYLPPEVRPNNYFSDVLGLETSNEWISSRTGIKNRHVVDSGVHVSDLATQAAQEALKMAGMRPADLKQIFVATATPKFLFPYDSNFVQFSLDKDVKTPAMLLGNACNGGLAGLELSYAMVASGFRPNAMIIGAEVLTKFVDYSDRRSCVLFGDGAAAAIVALVENPGPFAFVMGSDGSKAENIIFEGGGTAFPATEENIKDGHFRIKMEGQAVFEDAVPCMVDMTNRALEMAGVNKSDVRLWFPHQANEKIMRAAARRLGFQERMVSYIGNMGNISAASIFVAMHDAFRDGWLQKGDIIAMAAIGSGYNFGGGVIQWNIDNPTPRPSGKFSDRSNK